MTCNLLLVDDHSLIRAGVRALVADIPGYAIVGEAADGAQLSGLAQRLEPDIILLDIWMKSIDGFDALKQLFKVQPHCKVLILSMHYRRRSMVARALDAGARGYLLKDTTATELEQALEALRNDERYLSPAIAHTVLERAVHGTRAERAR
ncbi:response regulator transcription factor, partial [Pseudomonas syringae pv. actinidiae]|nr:response regulator transcription factor [Pseudomonas syringae pv. actinidiae]